MKIEISEVFLKERDKNSKMSIELDEPKKVIEILEEMGIENLGYANFYLNDVKVDKNATVKNQDKLIVLPIVGGG
ncbi:MAG: MoaD/ThiS family protein [Eubacteriales bacterium]